MTGLVKNDPYLRVKKLFDGKKFEDIIIYCQKLLEKDPKDKFALQNLSTAYNMIGAYNDALIHSDTVLELDFTDEFALKNKMFAYEKLENHEEVIKCCKLILEKNNGDIDKSIEFLRKKGIAKASKKMERVAADGLVCIYEKDNKFAMIEINSETDFVAKNADFINFAEEISQLTFSNFGKIESILNAKMKNKKIVKESLVDLILEEVFLLIQLNQ